MNASPTSVIIAAAVISVAVFGIALRRRRAKTRSKQLSDAERRELYGLNEDETHR